MKQMTKNQKESYMKILSDIFDHTSNRPIKEFTTAQREDGSIMMIIKWSEVSYEKMGY